MLVHDSPYCFICLTAGRQPDRLAGFEGVIAAECPAGTMYGKEVLKIDLDLQIAYQ